MGQMNRMGGLIDTFLKQEEERGELKNHTEAKSDDSLKKECVCGLEYSRTTESAAAQK